MPVLAINGGKPVRAEPFPAYPTYGKEEEEEALRVIRSNALCSQVGREVEEFEQAYAAYHGCAHAVGVTNGTIALHVALAAAGVGPGDEVIVPPYTFVATATAVLCQNAVPVFADIEDLSLGLDPAAVEAAVTARTRAMIPVHMNGIPCDMDALLDVANRHDLVVIEDCSHAHGAVYGGRKVGTLGHMGAFSFQHKKNMSLGEGGAVVTNDDRLAGEMRRLRCFGGKAMLYNYRMTELHGAIGKARLAKLDAMNEARRANAATLDRELAGVEGICAPRVRPDTTPVYYNYVPRYSPETVGVPKARLIEAVQAEGVPVLYGYRPVHREKLFAQMDVYGRGCPFRCPLYDGTADYANESYPVAERLCDDEALEIKTHPPCGEREMRDIAAAIRKVIENAGELGAA